MGGVYGGVTRTAIVAWQQANDRPATGFISDADAVALLPQSPPQAAAIQPALPNESALPRVAPTVSGEEVQLKERGGVYRVPVRVNDAITLDFTIDSGASDVQIPADAVMTLFRTETLTDRDLSVSGLMSWQMAPNSPSAQPSPA